MEKIEHITTTTIAVLFAIAGVASLVGWIITGMWHCLMFAAIGAALTWVWYNEDYKSKH